MTACLDTETHPTWCEQSEGPGVGHASTLQYWRTSTENQQVCLWLLQERGETPRVILGNAQGPEEYTLLLTIEEAADLIGRLAPLVAAAMPRGRCAS
jgi:hypothetical protein